MIKNTGYRPNRSQQVTLALLLETRGYHNAIIHHVIEDTPLRCVVQIEYRAYELEGKNTTESPLVGVRKVKFERVVL